MGENKVNGRKRQCWVDTNGFLLRVLVHPADISDTEGAEWLLAAYHQSFPRMQEIRVDEGYKQGLNEWMQQNTTIRRNSIEKPPGQTGCAVIPKRWVVERSIAWAGRHRLLRRIIIRRNNRTPESSEAFLYLGSIAMLLNRLYPRCSFLITLLIVDEDGSLHFLSDTYEGSVHEKRIADEAGYALSSGSVLYQDTGFQGFHCDGVLIMRPKKRPPKGTLTAEEKAENRRISSIRVRIEQSIGSVKRYRIIRDVIRSRCSEFRDKVIETCCGLHNFRLIQKKRMNDQNKP